MINDDLIDCSTQSCINCPENATCNLYQNCLKDERYEKALHALLGLAVEAENDTMIDIILDALNECDLMEQYKKYVAEGIKFKMEML